jgi:hypothetical protein
MCIECDGATYHSSKSARDRDRLKQTILERLGWRIRRIWSTDWFKNPHAELQPIIRELNSLKTEIVDDYKPEAEYEETEIEEPIQEFNGMEAAADKLRSEDIDLTEKLLAFDKGVIRKALPDTPENQRLLRPAMLEAFVEYMPFDKTEFLEFIPSYLRQATYSAEGKFLEGVLGIISAVDEKLDS